MDWWSVVLFSKGQAVKTAILAEKDGHTGGEGGIRTLDTLLTYTHFPGVRLQPLGHLSDNCRVNQSIKPCNLGDLQVRHEIPSTRRPSPSLTI